MSRRCTVCQHTDRPAIDLALASGRSIRDIAGQFALSRTAVGNHAATHLRQALACASPGPAAAELQAIVGTRQRAELAANASVRDHVTRDLAALEELIEAALAKGQHGSVAMLLRVKYFVLGRTGIALETERPISLSPEAITDPAELKARAFEQAADEMHKVLMAFRSDTKTIKHAPALDDEELPDSPVKTVRHRTRIH